MIFGNWEVNEYGIEGHNAMSRYNISREDLELLINNEYVDKLINITEKSNVNSDEVFYLNYAFVYALGKFSIESITDIHLFQTKQRQLKILNFPQE